jgi:uncharacterized protein YbdZ (MbtH family)
LDVSRVEVNWDDLESPRVTMRWLSALACLTVTTAALNPRVVVTAPSLRVPVGFRRMRKLVAQYDQYPLQQANDDGLPAGWTMEFDEASGSYYYRDEQTTLTQWEPPEPNCSPMQKTLPAGWTLEYDQASGTEYYCNAQSGQCQWDPPQPSIPRGGCDASKREGYVMQHNGYDPRSATQTYEQYLETQG